jgi:ABC-type proline/glycine betaine transport system substrate-binding protein
MDATPALRKSIPDGIIERKVLPMKKLVLTVAAVAAIAAAASAPAEAHGLRIHRGGAAIAGIAATAAAVAIAADTYGYGYGPRYYSGAPVVVYTAPAYGYYGW